jgi:hypothetical protein
VAFQRQLTEFLVENSGELKFSDSPRKFSEVVNIYFIPEPIFFILFICCWKIYMIYICRGGTWIPFPPPFIVFTLHNTEITFGLENYADGEHEQRRHTEKILFLTT